MLEVTGAGLQAFLVHPPRALHHDTQAGRRVGAADEPLGDLDRFEHDGPQRVRHMAEQAMLDGIVLRAAGRVVSHLDVAQPLGGQPAELLLEAMLAVAVAAAAVAQQQHARRVFVMRLPEFAPPSAQRVTHQVAGVRAPRQVHQRLVAHRVVHAIRHQAVFGPCLARRAPPTRAPARVALS